MVDSLAIHCQQSVVLSLRLLSAVGCDQSCADMYGIPEPPEASGSGRRPHRWYSLMSAAPQLESTLYRGSQSNRLVLSVFQKFWSNAAGCSSQPDPQGHGPILELIRLESCTLGQDPLNAGPQAGSGCRLLVHLCSPRPSETPRCNHRCVRVEASNRANVLGVGVGVCVCVCVRVFSWRASNRP